MRGGGDVRRWRGIVCVEESLFLQSGMLCGAATVGVADDAVGW